jgi:hypothetical protein
VSIGSGIKDEQGLMLTASHAGRSRLNVSLLAKGHFEVTALSLHQKGFAKACALSIGDFRVTSIPLASF